MQQELCTASVGGRWLNSLFQCSAGRSWGNKFVDTEPVGLFGVAGLGLAGMGGCCSGSSAAAGRVPVGDRVPK